MTQPARPRWPWPILATLLASCGGAHGLGSSVAQSYDAEIKFSGKGEELAPVTPAQVELYERAAEAPTGLYLTTSLLVARDYPSAESPHRDLGVLVLRESVRYQVGDEIWRDPDVVARRNDALRVAAAERGANALFEMYDQRPDVGRRNVTYRAVALSSAPPSYPSVAEVLGKLALDKDGFKEVKRFTATMRELPTRRPEPIELKAGHEYQLAIAFHPELVELGLQKGFSLGFQVTVDRDVVLDRPRDGSFVGRIDKEYDKNTAIPGVDGVFARGGAGTLGGLGRPVQIEMTSRSATIAFTMLQSMRGHQPLGQLGNGKADFVVYERKLPAGQLAEEVCDWCSNSAKSCSKREPLASCEKLRACFKAIEQPLSMCKAKYKQL